MAGKRTITKKKAARSPDTEAGQAERAIKDPVRLATEVYREVGGFRRFVEWASDEKNIGVFYRDMLLKMLAKGVEAESEKGETIIVRVDNRAKG